MRRYFAIKDIKHFSGFLVFVQHCLHSDQCQLNKHHSKDYRFTEYHLVKHETSSYSETWIFEEREINVKNKNKIVTVLV